MASFEIVGTIKHIQSTVQVSEKFAKREFVLNTDIETTYPQTVQFQLTQDKCKLLDTAQLGQQVKVHFNIRGREWTKDDETSFFNSLEAWKIEKVGTVQQPLAQQVQQAVDAIDDLQF